jgi:hypothetical protein
MDLVQEYQFVRGTLNSGGKSLTVTDGRLNGNSISFTINNEKYSGIVGEKLMRGTVTNASTGSMIDWIATR